MRTKEGKFIVFKIIVIAFFAFFCFKNYQVMVVARDGIIVGLSDESIAKQLGNDWTISIGTVKNKDSTMGRKVFNNYFIYIDSNEKIKVDGIEYAYINEGDQIYCIYNENNELIKIYSPQMYNYEGKKLNSKEINTSSADNTNAIRYCTDIFIIYCVILVSLILGTIIELIINTKYIDEKERLFHKDPINIRKRKRN